MDASCERSEHRKWNGRRKPATSIICPTRTLRSRIARGKKSRAGNAIRTRRRSTRYRERTTLRGGPVDRSLRHLRREPDLRFCANRSGLSLRPANFEAALPWQPPLGPWWLDLGRKGRLTNPEAGFAAMCLRRRSGIPNSGPMTVGRRCTETVKTAARRAFSRRVRHRRSRRSRPGCRRPG